MGKYVVDLWINGFDNEKDRENAELEFIEESLNMTSSSVSVQKLSKYENNKTNKKFCVHSGGFIKNNNERNI